jgi:hypothetical protein
MRFKCEDVEIFFLVVYRFGLMVWFMVLNATLNNISVISGWSVLLVEETGMSGENRRPVASHGVLWYRGS